MGRQEIIQTCAAALVVGAIAAPGFAATSEMNAAGYDNGPRGPAPTLGQHSFEILSGFLGLDDEQIAQAYASGAVA